MRASFVQPDLETWFSSFRFSVPIKVRFSETDALGHLNNVFYIAYFEQGRLDYFEALGVMGDLLDPHSECAVVAADIECHYLAQVFYGQPLRLYVKTARIGTSSLDLHYALWNEATSQMAAVARGALVMIDRRTGKSTPIPDSIKEAIASYEGLPLANR